MNGLKTLVLQDLTHVLPAKSFPLPPKLSSCNLHTAASTRRFWNFFEFSNKDEVPRDSEQCQGSKEIVPPEQIASEMREMKPKSAPAVYASIMHGHQQLQDPLTNCWNTLESVKEDSLMSLLDGNSVPKTMKWKLKGYKTLRRRQTDEFAFVPGGIYDLDVDLVSDVQKIAKNKIADVSPKGAKNEIADVSPKGAKNIEARAKDIILSTKAIEAKNHAQLGSEKHNLKNSNRDQPTKIPTEPASVSKSPVPQKLLSLPKVEQIKFLPILKPEVPIISMKCQSQPTARYSSQPSDNSQKPPLQRSRLARTTANRKPDRQETSEPPDTYSTDPRQYSGSEEAGYNVREYPMQMEPANPAQHPDRLETDAVDVYQNQLANNRRVFSRVTEERTMDNVSKDNVPQDNVPQSNVPQSNVSKDFAPGPWKHQRCDDRQTRFQGKFSQKSLYSVYESIGIAPREGPPLKIASPDLKELGRTSPCAATQAKLLQSDGNASQQQQNSYNYDDGSSMAGNGGGSRKPPPPYPPLTSRRSSSSNSSSLVKPLGDASRTMIRQSANSKIASSSISTSTRRPRPRKSDDEDEQMIEGKTICTKPRQNNKCSRQRDDSQKKSKPCKRYCCPALQVSSDCDWATFQCPKLKGETNNDRKIESKKKDPTCIPPEEEATSRNDVCTSPRRSCGRKERSCNQTCNKQASPRQRCKRERRSCERRERSCERQERRSCDRDRDRDRDQGAREICTKPRRRESSERRRDCNDRDCNRRTTKCNGRRNFTHSAYTRRPHTRRNLNRFFSLTTVGFSLVDTTNNDARNTLFRIPSGSRYYGSDSSPCSVPSSSKNKRKKCKKSPAKCLDRAPSKSESKSKTEPKCKIANPKCKIETKEKEKSSTKKNLCDTSCGKSQKKENPCKAGSEGDRCAKRREQICKNNKASAEKSQQESVKDRAEREMKEMQECKKIISGKDKKKGEEKKAATGLERVISPCKQQSEKGSSGKASCVATPWIRLTNPSPSLFLNPENITVSSRPFSKLNQYDQLDLYDRENVSDASQNDYSHFGDEVLADSGTITNSHQQPEDMPNDSSTINNWFLSWFHS